MQCLENATDLWSYFITGLLEIIHANGILIIMSVISNVKANRVQQAENTSVNLTLAHMNKAYD